MDCPVGESGGLRTTGTGKSFFLEALGQSAVEQGMKVSWFTLESLGEMVRRCRADDSVTRVIGRILRADLVAVDDIGLLPVSTDAAEGLYRLVDAAYERRSVAISSNLHPAGFDELMPKTLATAMVDRLMHHAHVCQTSGDSVRLAQAVSGAGVQALGGGEHSPDSPSLRRKGPGVQPEPVVPVCDDGVTMAACAACGRAFRKQGRGRYCSGACRQAAWRRRKAAGEAMVPGNPALPVIYECTACETRYLGERRCPDCNLFNRRVGPGGSCPHCDEPVAISDRAGGR